MISMEKLKELDILGKAPSLFYKSSQRYKTILGALLSVTVVTMSTALMIYFFVRVLLRSNVFVIESREYEPYQELDLSEYNQMFQVTTHDGSLFPLEQEQRLFTYALLYFYTEDDNNPKQKYEFYSMEPCTTAHLGKFAYLYEDIQDLERYYCLPLEFKLKLFGVYGGKKKFSGTFSNIRMCENGEYNKTNCLPKEKILSKIEDFYVNIVYIDYNIQNDNTSQSGVPYLKQDRMQVGTNYLSRFFYELTVVEYVTDFGLIFPSTSTEKFFTMSDYRRNQADVAWNTYFGTTFSIGRNKVTVNRSFEKLQQVLSNIGGAVKALSIGGQLVLTLLYDNFYYSSLFFPLRKSFSGKTAVSRFTRAKDTNLSTSTFKLNKENKENNLLDWTDNLKIILCLGTRNKQFEYLFEDLKGLLSIENVVKTQVECNNLKHVLFSNESATVFENLGIARTKKIDCNKAFEAFSSKNRDFHEEKLLNLAKNNQ